jgi:hypothetical protein
MGHIQRAWTMDIDLIHTGGPRDRERQRQRRQRTEKGDGGRDIGTNTGVLGREGRDRGGGEQKKAMGEEK